MHQRTMALALSLCSAACTVSSGDDGAGGSPTSDASAPSLDASSAICSRCGDCEQSVSLSGGIHVTVPIDYPDPPPAGGNHDPCWANFGTHDEPVPAERWVHNLEHGGVAFLYHCPEGCDDEVAQLSALADADRPFALVTAYAELPARFAVVAWGERLVTDCLDLEAFAAFYAAYHDRAPESSTLGEPTACIP